MFIWYYLHDGRVKTKTIPARETSNTAAHLIEIPSNA